MLIQQLTSLKDYVLQWNPYFDRGFDRVRMDDARGWILSDDTPVFPADDLGNFFYLRLPSKISYDYSNIYSSHDNKGGVGIVAEVILVACMRDADEFQLAGNLITTIGNWQGANTQLRDTLLRQDDVVMQEMAKFKKPVIEACLQGMPEDMTMVSITFKMTASFKFKNLNCLSNPCKSCN